MNVHLNYTAGSSAYRVTENKAYDQCPTCQQWFARHPGILEPWRCDKCDLEWGADKCANPAGEGKVCGGGIADLVRLTPEGDLDGNPYRVCMKCGAMIGESEGMPELTVHKADTASNVGTDGDLYDNNLAAAIELMNKCGFNLREDGSWELKFSSPMLAGYPQGVLSQLHGSVILPPFKAEDGETEEQLMEKWTNFGPQVQLSNILSVAFEQGFNSGLLHMTSKEWDRKHVLDSILQRLEPGKIVFFYNIGWVCTKKNGKKGATLRSSVGGQEVEVKRYKPDTWKEILKPIFDAERAEEEANKSPEQRHKEALAAEANDPTGGATDEALGISSMTPHQLEQAAKDSE